MEININLSDNLKLHYTETLFLNLEGTPGVVKFFFTFFKQGFYAFVSDSHIKEDIHRIEAQGPADTFDDFVHQIQNEYWNEIKEVFLKHVQNDTTQPNS